MGMGAMGVLGARQASERLLQIFAVAWGQLGLGVYCVRVDPAKAAAAASIHSHAWLPWPATRRMP